MTTLQQLSDAQASPEVVVNENFETTSIAGAFGKRHAATSGLTWGYYGARYNGNDVADGTVTLTDDATNYIVVKRSDGVVSVATSTTNWSNATDYARLYQVTAASGAVAAAVDCRLDTGGLLNGGGGGGGGGGSTIGRHEIYIAAGSMRPSVTGGCSALTAVASAASQPDIVTLDFDPTTQEHAQFGVVLAKKWNRGTVTFAAHWSHASTTTNFGVVFDLQAVAVGNDDAIATAFGTAQAVTDTGGTTNDLYTSPESSAITVAGTPAAGDMVFFRLSRVTGNGSDTLAVDARLHGITLYVTTDADTDA